MPSGDIMNMVNAVWPFILMAAIFLFLIMETSKKGAAEASKDAGCSEEG